VGNKVAEEPDRVRVHLFEKRLLLDWYLLDLFQYLWQFENDKSELLKPNTAIFFQVCRYIKIYIFCLSNPISQVIVNTGFLLIGQVRRWYYS